MRILTVGHKYELTNFEQVEKPGQVLQFIEKTPVSKPQCCGRPPVVEFQTVNDGTTNEEVLAVLIDRLGVMNAKFPCRENSIVITKLEESLMWLNKRTADRKARGVEGKPAA